MIPDGHPPEVVAAAVCELLVRERRGDPESHRWVTDLLTKLAQPPAPGLTDEQVQTHQSFCTELTAMIQDFRAKATLIGERLN